MFAEWRKVLLGIHPEWRHSPPNWSRSIKAVRAPALFAAEAATRPADPAPMTQISYSFIHSFPLTFFHNGHNRFFCQHQQYPVVSDAPSSGPDSVPEIVIDPFSEQSLTIAGYYIGLIGRYKI